QNQYQNLQIQMATLTDMMSKFVSSNTDSSSESGTLPADFVVVDFEPDPRVPLILERCFLKTSRALIDVHNFSNVTASGTPTPHNDPIVFATSPTLTPFGDSDFLLFEEADAFLGLEDDPDSSKINPFYYDPKRDILLLEAILNTYEAQAVKSSVDEPLEVELKDLTHHLEYAFLEGDNKLPVIIVKELGDEEKSALIKVLKSHKRAIAWKLSDIQGINPKFYTHKILMEEDYKLSVQHQRRFFPPSKTTNLHNEITRFQQRFDESFYEAWERFNDLLRACRHHGFSELHQLDTFYNALNVNDQDSLNSTAGGNFLDKMPRECLKIIESKSKVRQSRAKTVVAKVGTSSSTPSISFDVVELKDMVKALLLDKKNQSPAPTPSSTPAPVKAVGPNRVTCGGAHSYQNCPATSENAYRDNIQEYVSQAAAANYNQGNISF
nr:reverse transcriptase domain-containing protein [Tanacetum cinerariifolium]